MVVEQRIGGLHRFGQKAERILISKLSAPGAIEDEILTGCAAASSYGLEAILGSEITHLAKDLSDPSAADATQILRWIAHAKMVRFGCGGRISTCDLWVMSLASASGWFGLFRSFNELRESASC